MKSTVEIYKCAILTVIALLLGGILWRIPAKPLTLGQMRAARTNGTSKRNVMDGVAVVYVQDGSVNVDNLENPLPVQVENTVEAEIVR
jgi:hypothetical protein